MEQPQVLSFPAILRNPGLSDRFAHLHLQEQPSGEQVRTVKSRRSAIKQENEGKRWVRRKDNVHFTDNPHIVAATKADYTLPLPDLKATFPEPLPPYLHRNTKVLDTEAPKTDPNSANAGRFSLSLKGMRRSLRKCGFRAEALVRDIEAELLQWLQAGGTILNPDQDLSDDPVLGGMPIRNTETIFEVSRTPLQLIWYTNEDNFARYVIHCCARYHEVVSFSKETSGRRLTYLLRPNVTRPDHRAPTSLETPPTTDIDYSSHFDTESERAFEMDSDAESVQLGQGHTGNIQLSSIAEDIKAPSGPQSQSDEETWSIVGDDEVEMDSPNEHPSGLAAGMNSMKGSPRTPRHRITGRRRIANRGRGVSSPSRSPAPRAFRRPAPCCKKANRPQTFYEFLFNC